MKDVPEDSVGFDSARGRAAMTAAAAAAMAAAAAAEIDLDGSDAEAGLEDELELVLLPQDDGTEMGGRELGNRAAAMPEMRPTAAAVAAEKFETLLLLLLPPM